MDNGRITDASGRPETCPRCDESYSAFVKPSEDPATKSVGQHDWMCFIPENDDSYPGWQFYHEVA